MSKKPVQITLIVIMFVLQPGIQAIGEIKVIYPESDWGWVRWRGGETVCLLKTISRHPAPYDIPI
jgi:hypothetical protein